jgi:uncharacterized membrane protein
MMQWADAFRVRQYVKGSLWLIPLLGALLGPLLALLDIAIEDQVRLPEIWHYSAGTASGVLTAIVGAMVGLLGFVVTIGVLVVQTATSTLSPRFMRLWYRDRLQKVVLATFALTFTFAFTLLRRTGGAHEVVPNLGVTVAGFLVSVSLILLLFYLDRFTHSLRPVAVGSLVARAALRTDPASFSHRASAIDASSAVSGRRMRLSVPSVRPGVVQALDVNGLIDAAARHDCVVVILRSPGDFVPMGGALFRVYGNASVPPSRDLTGRVALDLERTIEQDAAFGLRILVDIAIRALSPAVNDPTTAVQMIDQIEVFLTVLVRLPVPGPYWVLADPGGTARLLVPARSVAEYLQLALTEIIEYGAGAVQVCRRLAAMLDSLLATATPVNRAAIEAERAKLATVVSGRYVDPRERAVANRADYQGIGGPSPT